MADSDKVPKEALCVSLSSLKTMEKQGQGLVWGGGSAEKLDLQGTMLALSSHHYHTRERCTGPALTFIQVNPPGEEEGTGETASRCMGLKQEAQRGCLRGKNMEVPPPAL